MKTQGFFVCPILEIHPFWAAKKAFATFEIMKKEKKRDEGFFKCQEGIKFEKFGTQESLVA